MCTAYGSLLWLAIGTMYTFIVSIACLEVPIATIVPAAAMLLQESFCAAPVVTTGSHRHKESTGLFGLQPIIEPSSSLTCKTGITLNAIKVGQQTEASGSLP